jgi:protein-tyrosine-phosphatase
MKKIVFICKSNIFRSQIAKGLCEHLSGGKLICESYGVVVKIAGDEGHKISSFPGMIDTINMLKEEGVDISNEICKQVTPEDLEGVHKIFVMSEREFIPDWLNKYNFEYWDIPNPPVITSAVAKNVIEIIKSKILIVMDNEAKNS